MADGVPHLTASARRGDRHRGTAGPSRSLGLPALPEPGPGRRDPAWPLVLAQLIGRQPGTPACDCVLATSVASQASAQVLAFADRGRAGRAVTNGTLELVLPGWQWRRRTWPPQAAADATASRSSK